MTTFEKQIKDLDNTEFYHLLEAFEKEADRREGLSLVKSRIGIPVHRLRHMTPGEVDDKLVGALKRFISEALGVDPEEIEVMGTKIKPFDPRHDE